MGLHMTLEHKEPADKGINTIIKERCKKILEKFGQVAISHVKDPKLLAALEDVKNYWRDLNRPSLTLFSCEAVGGDPEISEDAALMLTLASSGFGLHDDILDRSENKHLRMTILGLHGADIALLVGDLLMVKAWTVAHEMVRNTCNPTKIADILKVYGNLSVEICEAELMETQCRGKVDMDLDFYKNILWKEMAETEACSRIGAMLGEGKPDEVEALAEFGRRLGFMSRLADDIEDCLNEKGDLPHRIRYESLPLPLLYAAKCLASSDDLGAKEQYKQIKNITQKIQITSEDVRALLRSCFETEAFEYVREIAEKNAVEATRNLELLKPSSALIALSAMNECAYARLKNRCI
jgi:geranylgeranyl diphosphate synthase type I